MSEYWKSTPKYWCKHCKTFVRDTKLERTNHDATPKHQGNLKRFLRDLHRGHEKDEMDKERAKAEVARLNGVVSSAGPSGSSGSSFTRNSVSSGPRQQATAADVIRQREQLSEMGVAIPDEFRREMAMVGDWQVTSERVLDPEEEEKKPDAIGYGVRKRPAEEEDEELRVKRGRWGSAYRTHPVEDDNNDLDALLSNVTSKGKEKAVQPKIEEEEEIKEEAMVIKPELGMVKPEADVPAAPVQSEDNVEPVGIKKEPSDHEIALPARAVPAIKPDGAEQAVGGVVFKKRKAKNVRQK